jgi:hypothetical protein
MLGYNHTYRGDKGFWNCFATGPASGRDKIGRLEGTTGGAITNSFAVGNRYSHRPQTKAGWREAKPGTLTACYWE